MSWSYETSCRTEARPSDVWALLSDVSSWSDWNAGIDAVHLDTSFDEGAVGTLTPAGQEPLPFRIVACTDGVEYTSQTVIAETVTLVNTQRIEPRDNGATVHAKSSLTGEAAEYFGQSFGPQLAERLPATLESLCRRAERRNADS